MKLDFAGDDKKPFRVNISIQDREDETASVRFRGDETRISIGFRPKENWGWHGVITRYLVEDDCILTIERANGSKMPLESILSVVGAVTNLLTICCNETPTVTSFSVQYEKGDQRPARIAPTNPDRLKRDIHIQFTIGLLERLGIPPYGTDVSGCRIVSEALLELSDGGLVPKAPGLSEGAVECIWKECTWRTSFMPVMRKYSEGHRRTQRALSPLRPEPPPELRFHCLLLSWKDPLGTESAPDTDSH